MTRMSTRWRVGCQTAKVIKKFLFRAYSFNTKDKKRDAEISERFGKCKLAEALRSGIYTKTKSTPWKQFGRYHLHRKTVQGWASVGAKRLTSQQRSYFASAQQFQKRFKFDFSTTPTSLQACKVPGPNHQELDQTVYSET